MPKNKMQKRKYKKEEKLPMINQIKSITNCSVRPFLAYRVEYEREKN